MEQRFIELFKEAIERESTVSLNDNFRNYPEWDSLAYLSIISVIDEEYDVIIEGNEFKELNTIEDIISEIKKKKS